MVRIYPASKCSRRIEMDPVLHTLLAIGCMVVSFYVGKAVGVREGMSDVWQSLLTLFKAKSIEVDDDLNMFITDYDGNDRKIN
jgi:hypothetical protein